MPPPLKYFINSSTCKNGNSIPSKWRLVCTQYFERSNMIGRGKASQLQMNQSAAMYCLKFGYLPLGPFQNVPECHIFNRLGIAFYILERLKRLPHFKRGCIISSPLLPHLDYLKITPHVLLNNDFTPYQCIFKNNPIRLPSGLTYWNSTYHFLHHHHYYSKYRSSSSYVSFSLAIFLHLNPAPEKNIKEIAGKPKIPLPTHHLYQGVGACDVMIHSYTNI